MLSWSNNPPRSVLRQVQDERLSLRQPQTANGGQHCCRPPLYVRSGFSRRVSLRPLCAGLSLLTAWRLQALLGGAFCAVVASGRMPSGALSPWAAADPCFRTRSRRYPSFRPSATVECRHSSFAPVTRDCFGCSCERSERSRSWAFPFVRWLSSNRASGVKCCPPPFSPLHRAGWRPKPARAL